MIETQAMFGGEMEMNEVSLYQLNGNFLLPTSAIGSSTSEITELNECRPEDTMPDMSLLELQPGSCPSSSSSSVKSDLEDLRVTSLAFLGFGSDCGFAGLPLLRARLVLDFEAEGVDEVFSASEECDSSLLG